MEEKCCCAPCKCEPCKDVKRAVIGEKAPQFSGEAYINFDIKKITLADYKGKNLVLFFYPLDFTFVCPTEIVDFDRNYPALKALNCELIGCSVDSVFTHREYSLKPRKQGGLGELQFPLLSDITKQIAANYGALAGGANAGVALRATIIIDDEGIIRHMSANDLDVGRNVEEIVRLVEAFNFAKAHGSVCPANWHKGAPTLKPAPGANAEYWEKEHTKKQNIRINR